MSTFSLKEKFILAQGQRSATLGVKFLKSQL